MISELGYFPLIVACRLQPMKPVAPRPGPVPHSTTSKGSRWAMLLVRTPVYEPMRVLLGWGEDGEG